MEDKFLETERKRIQDILDNISYLDWIFYLGDMGNGFYLQVQFEAPDVTSKDKNLIAMHGRKYYISPHMVKNEIIQTALKAVLTAVEHEARENFTYKSERIYQPHLDAEFLVNLCKENRTESRSIPEKYTEKKE